MMETVNSSYLPSIDAKTMPSFGPKNPSIKSIDEKTKERRTQSQAFSALQSRAKPSLPFASQSVERESESDY